MNTYWGVIWRVVNNGCAGLSIDVYVFLSGDLWSFNPLAGEYLVSPVPDVHYRLIDPRKDRFVVLASDGLWNAMKNKEVVHFIDNIEKNDFDGIDWRDDVTHRYKNCFLFIIGMNLQRGLNRHVLQYHDFQESAC